MPKSVVRVTLAEIVTECDKIEFYLLYLKRASASEKRRGHEPSLVDNYMGQSRFDDSSKSI